MRRSLQRCQDVGVSADKSVPLYLGVGEVLWDRLPGGDALGGAPLNVISHLARLGYQAAYLTAVGQDPPGDAALAAMAARGVDPSLARRIPGLPTGLARVTLGPGGSPEFAISRPAAFEHWADEPGASKRGADARAGERGSDARAGERGSDDRAGECGAGKRGSDDRAGECGAGQRGAGGRPADDDGAIGGLDAALGQRPAVLVYGTLAQLRPEARAALARIAAAAPVALYDVNLRDGWWTPAVVAELTGLATVLKLSLGEARELAGTLGADWTGAEGTGADWTGADGVSGLAVLCAALARRHGLRGVAVTAGPDPAALWLDGAFAVASPPAIKVADPVLADPVLADTVLADPVLADTVLADTVLADPVLADTVLADPVLADPVLADPVLADPVLADPVLADPVLADTVLADPVLADPVLADTVGAGDAFAAGLLDAIGRGLPAAAALRRASALGALVASRRGAQPEWTVAELAVIENN
jgi:sugar/nucleoside kinase (ribokinase family)